ncbi:hypothetical protein CDEST_14262 [Colletotrichum destructivum]|uniref:EC41 protein n=1 Tax=Colletotrichum destructivum TaxID=34406 RepID=A0AAX4J113_9PEZI|nr:hypothetical protein CDEST_14262 [Colletotrichum destructivum]
MKRRNLAALPGLQAAAALYLARASEAKVFCADTNVVSDASCQGAHTSDQFFAADTQVDPDVYDASNAIMRKYPPPTQGASAPQSFRSLQLRQDDWYCDTDGSGVGRAGGNGAIIVGYFGRGTGSSGG